MITIPATCWLCLMPLALAHHGFCNLCLRSLRLLTDNCPRCGLPARDTRFACGRCQQHPPPWLRLIAVSDWQPPLSDLVRKLKFYRATALSGALARLLLLRWLAVRRQYGLPHPDLLLSVPLHKHRARQRGYNQLSDITRYLAHWCGGDYAAHGLTRIRKTRIQHSLHANARRKNLRGAFRLEIAVAGRHITLVDDVVTTGSTAGEISRLLLAAGASSVQIWCLCRTL